MFLFPLSFDHSLLPYCAISTHLIQRNRRAERYKKSTLSSAHAARSPGVASEWKQSIASCPLSAPHRGTAPGDSRADVLCAPKHGAGARRPHFRRRPPSPGFFADARHPNEPGYPGTPQPLQGHAIMICQAHGIVKLNRGQFRLFARRALRHRFDLRWVLLYNV